MHIMETRGTSIIGINAGREARVVTIGLNTGNVGVKGMSVEVHGRMEVLLLLPWVVGLW